MNLRYLVFLALFLSAGCLKKMSYHVFSPDRKHCITIFEFDGFRYIAAGNVNSVPSGNYVKIQTNVKTAQQDDEFAGCWNDGGFEWKATIDGAKILENKLDTTKYFFSNKLPLDTIGVPDLLPFTQPNCFHFGFDGFFVLPKGHAIIE